MCNSFISIVLPRFLIFLSQGGNDYEIFTDARTIGHTVNGPEDTMQQVTEVLTALNLKQA
jgi:hypothetical protein